MDARLNVQKWFVWRNGPMAYIVESDDSYENGVNPKLLVTLILNMII